MVRAPAARTHQPVTERSNALLEGTIEDHGNSRGQLIGKKKSAKSWNSGVSRPNKRKLSQEATAAINM
jgi:hypothetical protein